MVPTLNVGGWGGNSKRENHLFEHWNELLLSCTTFPTTFVWNGSLAALEASLRTLEASGGLLYLAFILIIEQQGGDWQIKCMHNKEY